MATYTIETNADYWQLKDANDKMLDLTTYQAQTYSKACTLISDILQQIIKQIRENGE